MPSPNTLPVNNEVLHLRNSPLTRVEVEGLRAIGVEVVHLIPGRVEADLMNDATRDVTLERLTRARVCVLDAGTSAVLATAVLRLRESGPGQTLTTTEHASQVAAGLHLSQALVGGPPGRVEAIRDKAALLVALRGLGDGRQVVTSEAAAMGAITRPAKRLEYVADPEEYTYKELFLTEHGDPRHNGRRAQLGTGRILATDLLAPGACERYRDIRYNVVPPFLIQHLPSEDLGLLSGEEAEAWWAKLVRALQLRWVPEPQWGQPWQRLSDLRTDRRDVEALFWHALARDGGTATLARLPAVMEPLRDQVVTKWDAAVREATERMAFELTSPEPRQPKASIGASILMEWNVIPCEDPLAADADPNRFCPSLTTFEVARRYRSAPEVILAARERWGSRPYLRDHTAAQLGAFVGGSPPTSAEELDGWVRVLQTLPPGRMRNSVLKGMEDWQRVEVVILDARNSPTDEGEIAAMVPCFNHEGHEFRAYQHQIRWGSLDTSIGNLAAWEQRMGFEAWPRRRADSRIQGR